MVEVVLTACGIALWILLGISGLLFSYAKRKGLAK